MLTVEASQAILNRESKTRTYSPEESKKLRDVLYQFARVHLEMIKKQNGKKDK